MSSFHFLSFLGSLGVSLVLIPILAASAGRLQILDFPGGRKIHSVPVAKVGGVGFVFGAFVAILLWAPQNNLVFSFLLGGLIILFFGVWDDRTGLNYKIKFLGQFLAAVLVVWHAKLHIHALPFFSGVELPIVVSISLTVFFIVGVTNAFNLSDGLDGLAGGMSILSLCGMTFLAWESEHTTLMLILVSVLGGLLGFMRFNTYPARVFMGDGGSQFLGFCLAVSCLELTTSSDGFYSLSVCLLLLGLPVLDTLCVMTQRIMEGRSPFLADRNHIHHKLMLHGFTHTQAVLGIYGCQALFLTSAVLLRWQSDLVTSSAFLWFSLIVLFVFVGHREVGVTLRIPAMGLRTSVQTDSPELIEMRSRLSRYLVGYLACALALLFGCGAFLPAQIPVDFGYFSGLLFVLFLLGQILLPHLSPLWVRVGFYTGISFLLYLIEFHSSSTNVLVTSAVNVFIATIALVVFLAFWFQADKDFQVTPLDFLVVFIAIGTPLLFELRIDQFAFGLFFVKLVILAFAVELLLNMFPKKLAIFQVLVAWFFVGLAGLSFLGS